MKSFDVHFLRIFTVDLEDIHFVAQPVGLLKLLLKFVCTSTVQGRELCWHDFVTYTTNIVQCQDTCELICFNVNLSTMLNMTKLYSLIPVWMTLMYTQDHRVMGKYSHSVEKLHEGSAVFMMVDYVRYMTVKKSCMVHMDCLSICTSCFLFACSKLASMEVFLNVTRFINAVVSLV